MLEAIHPKTLVVNDPSEVRNAPEKLFVLNYAQFMPETLITRDPIELAAFRRTHGDIILKPLYGNGGAGVFRLGESDQNFSSLLELFTQMFREPFIAQQYDAPWALGLLYSAGFAGGLVFGLTSGWAIRIRHYGRAIALAAASWGAAIALMGIAPGIWWVLGLLAVAGYFDMLSGHFRSLMWNQSIPDDVRGRMAGIEMLSYSVGPMLGQVRSTAAAQAFGLRTSLASGGILCIIAIGVTCVTLPALWKFDARTNPHVAARRREADEITRTQQDSDTD
jgi:MFS family permease